MHRFRNIIKNRIMVILLVFAMVMCNMPSVMATAGEKASSDQADNVSKEAEPVLETEPPETEAPETEAPETEAPETEPPETEPPETEAPETEPPETEPPETEAPETEAPETEVSETDDLDTGAGIKEYEEETNEPIQPTDEGEEADVMGTYKSLKDEKAGMDKAALSIRFETPLSKVYFTSMTDQVLLDETPKEGKNFLFKLKIDREYQDSKITVYDTPEGETAIPMAKTAAGHYRLDNVSKSHTISYKITNKVAVEVPEGMSVTLAQDGESGAILTADSASTKEKQIYWMEEGRRLRIYVSLDIGYLEASAPALFDKSIRMDGTRVSDSNYVFTTLAGVQGSETYTLTGAKLSTYKVTLPGVTGAKLTVNQGQKAEQIPYNGSLSFNLTKETAYSNAKPEVRVNGVVLQPVSEGRYEITSITENKKVEVTGLVKNTYKVTLPSTPGLRISQVGSVSADKVAYGQTYQFKVSLSKTYDDSPVVMYVDGRELKPNSKGIYQITKIIGNKTVTVKNVRENISIVLAKDSMKVGETMQLSVANVPPGFKVILHNDTPTRGVINKKNVVLATKSGNLKLIAVCTKGSEKYIATKKIKVIDTKRKLKREQKTFKVDGITYTVTKSATADKRGRVQVGFNQSIATAYLTIPAKVNYNGRTYKVTSIGGNAFYGNGSLVSVSIPKSVSFIASTAFVKCRNLTEFNVSRENSFYRGDDRMLLSKDARVLIAYPSASYSVTIGGRITTIGPYALSASRVQRLTLEAGVSSISVCAFSHCNSLQNVKIKNVNAGSIQCGCAFDHVYANCRIQVPRKSMDAYKAVITGKHGTNSLRIRSL